MKNDQWFELGDKVMRVDVDTFSKSSCIEGLRLAPYGVIMCVSGCVRSRLWGNVVYFVGVQNETPTTSGFVASNFRRVEEIRLCVEAAKHIKKPEGVEA